MVRSDNLFLSVPTFFRCPISLDVMKSPVSLCTGVTYDRSSIQTWLDNGNNTCPATMQILQTKDFVPNHTLERLIHIWSDTRTQLPPLSAHLAIQLLTQITADPNPVPNLTRLHDFAKEKPNRTVLIKSNCVKFVVDFVNSSGESLEKLEAGLRILGLVVPDCKENEEGFEKMVLESNFLDRVLYVLQKGGVKSRIDSARVLEWLTRGDRLRPKISVSEREGFMFELLRLIGWESDEDAIDSGLSCLISLAGLKPVRAMIVRLGAVPLLGKLLQNFGGSIAENVAKLLEAVSTCEQGRAAISGDPTCVPAMVGKILKVSEAATERCVVVLWSVCHVFKDRQAQDKFSSSNGLGKILLLMQSNCSPAVRQMAGDLMKIFRRGCNAKSCLASYDTKTTHIMPF